MEEDGFIAEGLIVVEFTTCAEFSRWFLILLKFSRIKGNVMMDFCGTYTLETLIDIVERMAAVLEEFTTFVKLTSCLYTLVELKLILDDVLVGFPGVLLTIVTTDDVLLKRVAKDAGAMEEIWLFIEVQLAR